MAKFLKTAATIVGAVALVATGVGAVVGGVVATVGTVAGFAATALGGLAAVVAPKASLPATTISGNQSSFTASLDQGLPWLLGRTRSAGCAVHDITYDSNTTSNAFQSFYGVWSADRCQEIEATQIDNVTVSFATPNATAIGTFKDWMWHRSQLGLSPETGALKATDSLPYPPGWSTAAKLSGMAAFSWTLRFDSTGKTYPGGTVPQKRDIIKGALAYDPRKDDTYPGGSGAHREADASTWEWTENPFLLALKWARGITSNSKRVMGIGMALAAINVDSAVHAANIADANGWKAGGVVYSTDPKYDVLKKICAAGSGEPIRVGGMLHFLVDAPRVSLDTITTDDLIGKCTVPSGTAMKDRINGVIPTYREAAQDWQLVPATKVTVADYVSADGRPRTKAMTWELVQDVKQVATLATYAICNAREIDGIVLPCKVRWIGYKPGDAVTVASSVVAMDSQLVVLRKRNLDPATGAVTFTARTESSDKHAFSLGQTTTPPPTPALATVDKTSLLIPGVDASWIAITGDGKPEDNATVGAPAGTYVGGGATIVPSTWDDSTKWYDSVSWHDTETVATGMPSELVVAHVEDLLESVDLLATLPDAVSAIEEVGLSSAAADRQRDRDLAQLGITLGRLLVQMNGTMTSIRDAGIVTDPNTGTIRLFALDEARDHLNDLQVTIDAQAAKITLAATRTYVAEQIALAQIEPGQTADLTNLIARISQAEIDIDGLQGAITLKASATDVDRLGLRVSDVEQALMAVGDTVGIATTVRQARYAADLAGRNALAAIINGDVAHLAQLSALAQITQQLTTTITDGATAEATARLAIAVQIANNAAAILQEASTRADAVSTEAKARQLLEAAITDSNTGNAALDAKATTESRARVDGDKAQADTSAQIVARLDKAGGAGVSVEAGIAAAQKATADLKAVAATTDDLHQAVSQVGDTIASAVHEEVTRADQAYASVSAATQLKARLDAVGGGQSIEATVSRLDEVTADNTGKLTARMQEVAGVGGTVAGLRALVEQSDGTTTSDLALIAKKQGFWIQLDDGTLVQALALEAVNGVPRIRLYGVVTADELDVNAAMVPGYGRLAAPVAGTGM